MKTKQTASLLACWLGSATMVSAALAAVEFNASASLSNRYVTEGIDNDPDSSGYFFSTIAAESHGFTLGAWYAQSMRGSPYNEINIFGEYGFEVYGAELFFGMNFLTFPAPDDPDTWELFFGFEYPVHDQVVLFGGTYYDIDEVRGGFAEAGVAFPFQPFQDNERLEVAPYTLVGVDYGFVSGPRRLKANNWQIGVVAAYAMADLAALFGSVNHSFRLSNLRDEELGDVTWAEIGLSLSF